MKTKILSDEAIHVLATILRDEYIAYHTFIADAEINNPDSVWIQGLMHFHKEVKRPSSVEEYMVLVKSTCSISSYYEELSQLENDGEHIYECLENWGSGVVHNKAYWVIADLIAKIGDQE